MTVLGIETSTVVCSVGISCSNGESGNHARKSGSLIERSIVESHIHSEKLLTLIREICEEKNILLKDLDAIGISIGPGSFTGLRIGLSAAKGLCYSLMKPLIAVDTFKAIASSVFSLNPDLERVIVSIDAKQGESYRGAYRSSNDELIEISSIDICGINEKIAIEYDKTMVVTDHVDSARKIYPGSVPVEDVLTYCRGDIVAGLAIQKLIAGEIDSLDNLEPLYLKDFIIRSHSRTN